MFAAVPTVTGIFSLLAFVAAVAFFAYRARLTQNSDLLKSADSKVKVDALDRILRTYQIDDKGLSQDQRFAVAQKELDLHGQRQMIFAVIALGAAVLLGVVAIVYALNQPKPADVQTTSGDNSPAINHVSGDVTINISSSGP